MALRYWIGLNAADALLTAVALSMGAMEGNPVLTLFALRLGIPGMLFVKALFAIALGGVIWQRGKVRMLMIMNYVMLAVILYNMLTITYFL
ncbi:MAG: hypothetical protein HY680_02760 [Chloroflexi bacterium]|nr:hypothetical protein [Chloroflexota bacterium]